ncbi:MAG TPA: ABC transporter permease [Blastocatellia bacterium]|nr:ABC transporter permease [Blastocatellia bacterium]
MMGSLAQDLRYSLRMVLKNRGFSVATMMTLSLGLGANLTIFSFVDTLFLRPLPVREPHQLVTVEGTRNGEWDWGFAYPAYAYLRDHSQSFEALAAHYSTSPLSVVADGDSREVLGAVVSGNYFSMLGIQPMLGRFFLPEEDAVPDRDAVAVISHRLWQSRFAGDPLILGKEVRVNGTVFKVIGVTPVNFSGVSVGEANDMWIPAMMLRLGYRGCDGLNNFGCRPLTLLGRLAPGSTLATAQAELTTLAAQLAAAYPENERRGVAIVPAVGITPEGRRAFNYQVKLLMIVTGLLLLIACANVAGLLLVRGTARRKEIVIRLCLGAGRGRLVRQFMTESVLLALAGGALGVILSLWAKDLLLGFYTMSAGSHARFYDLSLNPRVLAYSFALSIFTGLLSGVIPALSATRHNLAAALKDDGRSQSSRHSRLRSGLVVSQVAVSVALLVAAGLLIRSADQVRKGQIFDPTNVALLRLRPALLNYSPEKAQAFTHEVIRRLESLPGVQSVSLATGTGLAWLSEDEGRVRLPEQAKDRPESELEVEFHEIAPRFFETLKMPLTHGRDFDERDRVGAAPVVIINETLAGRMWPDDSALGRTLIVNDVQREVVGVFKDSQLRTPLEGPMPFFYLPVWQNARHTDSRMVVRVTSDPERMLAVLRREIAAVDSKVPISEDMPMTRQVSAKYMPVLLTSSVALASGVIALFLSMVGLYSVLAFSVSQRTREIGIRMALGAQQQDVLKLILRQGIVLALTGAAVGLMAAFALAQVTASLLYGVSPTDTPTFVLIPLSLTVVATVASYLPARRATRVDPMVALRYE